MRLTLLPSQVSDCSPTAKRLLVELGGLQGAKEELYKYGVSLQAPTRYRHYVSLHRYVYYKRYVARFKNEEDYSAFLLRWHCGTD